MDSMTSRVIAAGDISMFVVVRLMENANRNRSNLLALKYRTYRVL